MIYSPLYKGETERKTTHEREYAMST